MNKSNLDRLFTLLVVILTTFQASIPAMPLGNENTRILVSAIVMFLVVALTAWKQFVSVEISNGSIIPTIIIAVVATLGGLNDLINAIHVNASLGQWLRFGITTIATILNISSKTLWPTQEGKAVENLKKQLSK